MVDPLNRRMADSMVDPSNLSRLCRRIGASLEQH